MKITSLSPLATLALSAMVVLAVATAAQTPQHPASEGGGHAPRTYPAPKNLKVLPKNTTGQQIHEIMEGWAGSLGVHCDTCHTADPKNVGPDGRPRLKFEDDSKDEKQMARIMYTMTEDIKKNYVKKVADMDKMDTPAAPLTCGTCHRGHLDPEKFVIPKEGAHGGPPPAGAMPPMKH